MKKPSQTLAAPEQLASLEQKIQQANTLLGNLEVETKRAQANQAQVKKQLQRETELLIQARKEDLIALDEGWRKRISELEDRYPEIRDQIKKQRLVLAEVESKITGAVAELEQHREALSVVQAQVVTERGNVSIYESKLAGIQAQISEVSQRIAPLHAEELKLTDSVAELWKRRNQIDSVITMFESDHAKQKLEHERTLHNLTSKAQDVALKIQSDEARWEESRQDLAVRATKLDRLAKTLEARELKLNRDEHTLARNSELMNL